VNTPFVLNGTYPLVATSKQFNAENDACQNMTSHSLKDSIALIHTGGCNALSKIMHAQQAGAKAVIMYTDVKNTTTNFQVLPQAVLPVAFINQQDANIAFYQANQAEFTNILIAMEAPESSTVSAFSTLGPTNELDLKPELMAIGGNVFSTLPRSRKSYGFASGTSFSAPYISGSIALYLANTKLDQTPEQVKSILMNSARQG
jgi:subtilisin family serine protease